MNFLLSNLLIGVTLTYIIFTSRFEDGPKMKQWSMSLFLGAALVTEVFGNQPRDFYVIMGITTLSLSNGHYISAVLLTIIYGKKFYLLSKLKYLVYRTIPIFYSIENEVDRMVNTLVSNDLVPYLYCIIGNIPYLFSILFIRLSENILQRHFPFQKEVTDYVVKFITFDMLIGIVKSIESFTRIAVRYEHGVIAVILNPVSNNAPTRFLYQFSLFRLINNDTQRWQYVQFLGRGAFGSVYEAITNSGSRFAVKRIWFRNERFTAQVENEIQIMRRLDHENIVRYYRAERSHSTLYIHLELMDGGSLQSVYLARRSPFNNDEISAYTRQVLQGLSYLHQNRIIHRDLKCQNILINSSGHVKLADFGLARVINSRQVVQSVAGTRNFMAPEIENNQGRGYGIEVDIWSLGCTVLEMSMATEPYRETLLDLPHIPNELSANMRSFIQQCLQIDPRRRPTVAQLLDHPLVN